AVSSFARSCLFYQVAAPPPNFTTFSLPVALPILDVDADAGVVPRIAICRTPLWSFADQDAQAAIEATAATLSKAGAIVADVQLRSEEHTSELQSREKLVCRLLLEKKK